MIGIEKPSITATEMNENGSFGTFVLEPLERGYGTTIGNSLRRVLLSSLRGYAITSVKGITTNSLQTCRKIHFSNITAISKCISSNGCYLFTNY